MKRALLSIAIFIFSGIGYAQNPGEWVWIHGDSTVSPPGHFGTQGIPSALNDPPGLYEPCEWMDTSGNFWLYGGTGPGNTMSDQAQLWKYNPNTNEWTWMKGTGIPNDTGNYGIQGIPSPSNHPAAKGWGVISWTDLNNNLWLYSGLGPGNNYTYPDLWKYDISMNEWTWMQGQKNMYATAVYGIKGIADTANSPGILGETAAAWTDSIGDLWFFGGNNNNVWRFNISTNSWTWMKGAGAGSYAGVYGIRGIEDSANTPGGTSTYCRWKDKSGNFWMFGEGQVDRRSTVWKFNPKTNNWTWMGGDTTLNHGDIYGTPCVLDSANLPGHTWENRSAWSDINDNLYVFGGGRGNGALLPYNDLWFYCITTNQWAWIKGNNWCCTPWNWAWGQKGVSNPGNNPDSRGGSVGWTKDKSHFYLFGGTSVNWPALHNDLWVYNIDPCCNSCSSLPHANFNSSDTAFCEEPFKCIDFYDLSTSDCNASWQWLFPGGNPSYSTLQNPVNICYSSAGTYAVTLIVTKSTGSDTLTVSPMITVGSVPAPPVVAVIGNDTLISSHGVHYQWYYNGNPLAGATDSFYVGMQDGTYAVMVTDSLGCTALSAGINVGIEQLSVGGRIELFPNPAHEWFEVRGWKAHNGGLLEVYTVLGEKVSANTLSEEAAGRIYIKDLPTGVYFIRLTAATGSYCGRVVKE